MLVVYYIAQDARLSHFFYVQILSGTEEDEKSLQIHFGCVWKIFKSAKRILLPFLLEDRGMQIFNIKETEKGRRKTYSRP
jgi:hypothetical protein